MSENAVSESNENPKSSGKKHTRLLILFAVFIVVSSCTGGYIVFYFAKSERLTTQNITVKPAANEGQYADTINAKDSSNQGLSNDLNAIDKQVNDVDKGLNETSSAMDDKATDLSSN